jgi:uncharacterized protein (TIGR02246 family)
MSLRKEVALVTYLPKCFQPLALAAVLFALSPAAARADELDGLRARIESYQTAFNRHDARGVAEHWSDEGVYEHQEGVQARGRDQIYGVFKKMFADDPRMQLKLSITSLRAVTRDVAIEDGKAEVIPGNGPSIHSTYTAVNVKRNGQWYVDTVRETENAGPVSHQDKLADLAWMIGEWVSEGDGATLRSKCEWTKNRSFIARSFTLHVKDRFEISGTQVIGYDAATGKIKCWTFDSEGGVAEGNWVRNGNSWSCKMAASLPDGRKGSAVHVLTYVNDNTFKWRSVGREVAGEILPNVDEFSVVRVTGE